MTDDRSIEDQTLVRRCLAGDAGAWQSLVSRYGPSLMRELSLIAAQRKIPVSGSDLDDLISKIWQELLRDDQRLLRLYRPEVASLDRWLLGIGVRRLLELARLRGREGKRLRAYGDTRLPVDVAVELPEAAVQRRELQERLQAAVLKLPPSEQFAVGVFYGAGWSHRRIARVLRIPVNRVGPVLAAARVRLKALLRNVELLILL